MTIKEKMKSYSFWVSLASALVLILKVIGSKFGFSIDASLASDIITSICSVLVIAGIIVTPTSKANADLAVLNSKSTTEETKKDSTNNSFKENLSILADNLKEVADDILNKDNTQNESQTATTTPANITQESPTENVEPCEIVAKTAETIISTSDVFISGDNRTIANENTDNSTEESHTINFEDVGKPITTNTTTAEDLKSVLALQKEKYIGNLDLYYQTLLEEVKSLKPNE